MIPASSENSSDNNMGISLPNSNSKNDINISPLVLSFYTERKEHLEVEIEQRKQACKRQEVEDEESTVSKRRKELDLVSQILNLL